MLLVLVLALSPVLCFFFLSPLFRWAQQLYPLPLEGALTSINLIEQKKGRKGRWRQRWRFNHLSFSTFYVICKTAATLALAVVLVRDESNITFNRVTYDCQRFATSLTHNKVFHFAGTVLKLISAVRFFCFFSINYKNKNIFSFFSVPFQNSNSLFNISRYLSIPFPHRQHRRSCCSLRDGAVSKY